MKEHRGFTLIELIVVIGVTAVIASLLLANFPRFSRQIAVEREAGKLALALRRAQSYALAVREFNSAFNDDPFCTDPPVRFPGYGVFFDLSDPTHYLIYGDASCSKYYESLPWEETTESALLDGKIYLLSIKGYDAGACSLGCDLNELSILYVRPDPAIWIRGEGADYNYAEIVLSSSDGTVTKKVVAWSTGQVSIE